MKAGEAGIKKSYSGIPPGMLRFLVRGIIIFVAWRLLYELVLRPSGSPDHELTRFLLKCTYHVLTLFYTGLSIDGYSLYINKEPIITFTTGCNGLELLVLYLSFLICYPSPFRRWFSFAVAGIIIINVLNIARCAALASWFYHRLPLWDFMHHYIFKIVIYGVNFYLWVLYCRANAKKKTA